MKNSHIQIIISKIDELCQKYNAEAIIIEKIAPFYDKLKKDEVISIFPSINGLHFQKNKKFDILNINSACKILLQKED